MRTRPLAARHVSVNRYSVFAAITVLALSATLSHAQETFEGAAGNSRMTAPQTRAIGTLRWLRSLRTDRAGLPSRIEADLGVLRSDTSAFDADSRTLLRNMASLYRFDGTESLRLKRTNRDEQGRRHVRVKQFIDGLEVIGGDAILHVDDATGRIDAIDSHFLSGAPLPRAETISANAAYDRALRVLAKPGTGRVVSVPRLAFARTPDAKGHLVWNADIEYADEDGVRHLDQLLLDARSGDEVWRLPRHHAAAIWRSVQDYNTKALLVDETTATTDYDAQMAMTNAASMYYFFLQNFQRDSWNGFGAQMKMFVHGTSRGQNNALYTLGTGVVEFGDGDGITNLPFARSRDVVVHEWVHAVTDVEAGLKTTGESGGLNEAMSDIFAAAVDASINGVTANTWLLGEDIYTPAIAGDAKRYLNDPWRDGRSMDFYPETNPSMDVHYLSGVANLAFYLLVNGGRHPGIKSSTLVTGIGMQDAQTIFYRALRDKLLSTDGFAAARNKTAYVAGSQFGGWGSPAHQAVCKAWDAVAVPNDGSECPSAEKPKALSRLSDSSRCGSISVIKWVPDPKATYYETWFSQTSDMASPKKLSSTGTSSSTLQVTQSTYIGVKACNPSGGCSAFSPALQLVRPRGACT